MDSLSQFHEVRACAWHVMTIPSLWLPTVVRFTNTRVFLVLNQIIGTTCSNYRDSFQKKLLNYCVTLIGDSKIRNLVGVLLSIYLVYLLICE